MNFNYKAYYFLIGFILSLIHTGVAQDQAVADSLRLIYLQGTVKGEEKLELLRNLAFNAANDLELSLQYADELIRQAQKEENYLYLYRGFSQKGQTYRLAGELPLALEAFFKCSEAAVKVENGKYEGGAYLTIADVYSEIGNTTNAEIYYTKSIDILRKVNDSLSLATALLNSGDEYFNSKNYGLALRNFEESGLIFKNLNYQIGSAYNLGNIGMVYAKQGKPIQAKTYINEAIALLEDVEDYYAISEYLTYMADIFLEQNDWESAVDYASRSLELALKYGLKKQISESNLKLSLLYEGTGNYFKSHAYYKDHIRYRDSVANIEKVQQMADQRTNYEVSKKQAEVDLLEKDAEIQLLKDKRQRTIIYITIAVLLLIIILAIALYRRNLFMQRVKRIIEKEKAVSETLLLNILPATTAEELKQNGKVQAKKFDSVTVLFTDFKDFTQYAENLAPEDLVASIDFYFSKFDAIMEEHGLEKIKTIGDAYMCAGGLQGSTGNHALAMVQAAAEIIQFVQDVKLQGNNGSTPFEIRIGINTGPVVAGVVGTKKFAYDIWGDTVNIASRMESNSTPGKINISEDTYALVKESVSCDFRGEIRVKNKGKMKMYFVQENADL
ncbi:adenylate/guanylate cyclase domain-containing protein [Constantimarinum furrinae]|uniref:Adenylate cyclase n=1 Tax=Constantimarinum furrinae TaxID=2562285 RepID=A0A7G8PWP7_9FLAO|nr:adenylate/guanylate cyclase domain-containing protein [Constantimarinum furrinae]QNJ98763.1 Adenylate cyclase [Constantimarinum furrinae]